MSDSVAAIVVTYNRLALLQECIAALRAQTCPPQEIIVVNNSSTDGTAGWLADQPDLTVITQANSGSSGGQCTGIKTAYHRGHDWFWCMDDDTIPEPDALQAFRAAPGFHDPDTGCLSSLVLDVHGAVPEGYFHPTHGPAWALCIFEDRCVRVTRSTFVSALMSRAAVARVGLPLRSFFINMDDWEYTGRIAAHFKNYCVLDSRVCHKAPAPGFDKFSGKYRHQVRNIVLCVRLQQSTLRHKCATLAMEFYHHLRDVLTRQAPPSVLWWFGKGLVAAAKIETV